MTKCLIPPRRICEWIGHDREGYDAGYYTDRRGRRRQRWHQRCKRCGTTDGGEVWNEGHLGRFRGWQIRSAIRQRMTLLRLWWRDDCDDCHKPCVRFGRRVGDHSQCNPIPF